MSRIDFIYRKFVPANFYSHGWGPFEHLKKIVSYRRHLVGKREGCLSTVPNDYPVRIDKEYTFKDHTVLEGSFETPFVHLIPELLPKEIQRSQFQFLIPKKQPPTPPLTNSNSRPVVFHYAGTGDHGFWRRRAFLAKPLMFNNSVASILIENPFYGLRKPANQYKSNLLHVMDLFIMGGCLVTESIVLMKWCEKNGYGPFVLTGLSMGGHMACLSSTVWPKPVGVVPCLSWTTAATVFTRGVLSKAIAWENLDATYAADKRYRDLKEELKYMHEEENRKRACKKVCSFVQNSPIQFNMLTDYSERKPHISMEVVEFMHLLMDECTHMLNFDMPVDPSLVHVIAAKDDAYVLRDGVNDFPSLWPGCQVEYVDQGHVSAFVMSLPKFRERIINQLQKLVEKHYSTNTTNMNPTPNQNVC